MAERDRSSRAAAGVTGEAVAQAALQEVARRGVAGLTMAGVADRLGVRAPSLYHHVRNKQSLLGLVAAHALAAFDADAARYAMVADLDGWIVLTADGSRRLRRHYLAHPGLAAVVQATADPDRDERPDARGALVRSQIDALVRLGVPPSAAKQAFQACAHWTLAAVAADSSGRLGGDDATFDRGLGWLLHGLRAELQPLIAGIDTVR